MKRFLNTLFVTTQGAYLKKDGETVAVKVDNEIKLRLPIITLSGIVCFGNIGASPFLLGHCVEHGVSVSFLTKNGRFLYRAQGPVAGNVLLRKEQYRISEDEKLSAPIVRSILAGKLSNSKTVLQRALRDHADKINAEPMRTAVDRLDSALQQIQAESSVDTLRGIEGDSAHCYFSAFDELITSQKGDFFLKQRSRRPPLDRVNALLSFVYTLLYHDTRAALEAVGLDPAVGFLHSDRPGRLSLALDLMEELRPFFADRLVLSLINLKQIEGRDFQTMDSGAVLMKDDARKKVIITYQKRKQDVIFHPYLNEKMHIGILFQVQAILLARFIRGDIDGYPPFLWR
jgi:CRISPR-associated protein Cas1